MTPKTVKVGPELFELSFRDPANDGMLNDGNYGYTLDQGNLIVISKAISLPKQRVTLMHEILHAARMIFEKTTPKKDAEYGEWEHHFIGLYETTLVMILRDNPDLIEWIQQS
jgi:Zn-dependent peptidase ImmA (M78 family)